MADHDSSKAKVGKSSTGSIKKRRRTWVLVGIVILLVILGYELITNWENFSRGVSGEPEATNSLQ